MNYELADSPSQDVSNFTWLSILVEYLPYFTGLGIQLNRIRTRGIKQNYSSFVVELHTFGVVQCLRTWHRVISGWKLTLSDANTRVWHTAELDQEVKENTVATSEKSNQGRPTLPSGDTVWHLNSLSSGLKRIDTESIQRPVQVRRGWKIRLFPLWSVDVVVEMENYP